MTAIEPDQPMSNLQAIATFAGYLLFVIGLTAFLVYQNIGKTPHSLPSFQGTRKGPSNPRTKRLLFASLTIASWAIVWYHMVRFFILSYRVWAHQMDEPLPTGLWTHGGILGQQPTSLALGRWLRDTSLVDDACRIVTERSGSFWWSQQIFLVAAPWSVFVGLEGRRRNIRHLWAFMLLGQIVAFSFAINLFFLMIISSPMPQQKRDSSASTTTEASHKGHSSTLITLTNYTYKFLNTLQNLFSTISPYILPPLLILMFYLPTSLLPFTTSTPHFNSFLTIAHLTLFPLLYWHHLIPKPIHNSLSNHLLRFIALPSTLLYLKQTIVALLDNNPGIQEHLPSLPASSSLHLSHASSHNQVTRSTTSAGGEILGALSDHPVVASVGSDVLMCALSLGVWSVLRGIKVRRMRHALIGGGEGEKSMEKQVEKQAEKQDAQEDERSIPSSIVRKESPSSITTISTNPSSPRRDTRRSMRNRYPSSNASTLPSASPSASPVSLLFNTLTATAAVAIAAADTITTELATNAEFPNNNNNKNNNDARPPKPPRPSIEKRVPEPETKPESERVEEEAKSINYQAGPASCGLFLLGGLGTMAIGVLGADVGGGGEYEIM